MNYFIIFLKIKIEDYFNTLDSSSLPTLLKNKVLIKSLYTLLMLSQNLLCHSSLPFGLFQFPRAPTCRIVPSVSSGWGDSQTSVSTMLVETAWLGEMEENMRVNCRVEWKWVIVIICFIRHAAIVPLGWDSSIPAQLLEVPVAFSALNSPLAPAHLAPFLKALGTWQCAFERFSCSMGPFQRNKHSHAFS